MPLHILAPMVIIGILGIGILLHLLGNSQKLALANADQVRASWLREHPETIIKCVEISDSGGQAIVKTDAGIGIIWVMGYDTTSRFITLPAPTQPIKTGLLITFNDFTAPRVKIDLQSEQSLSTWRNILAAKDTAWTT